MRGVISIFSADGSRLIFASPVRCLDDCVTLADYALRERPGLLIFFRPALGRVAPYPLKEAA